MANRKLVIEVVGDASKLDRSFKQAQASTTKFGRSLDGVSTGAALSARGLGGMSAALRGGGIALGLGLAAGQAQKFGQAASDLNEQISKSRQVFGQSSAQLEEWSRTTARSLGVSRTAALEAAGTFGNLFATVKIAPAQAAEMSRALVKLAADLASFNNADPSEVLDAIRSGLIGEAEPLRRFGVLLSEARVQQRAMADTGKQNAKSLTDQEKAVARYEIILGDTVKAQGDFARTSGGLANQQRILRAELADTQAELGEKFLPIQLTVTKALIQGADAAVDFGRALSQIKGPSGKQAFGWIQDGFQRLLEFERKLGVPGIKPDSLTRLNFPGAFPSLPVPPAASTSPVGSKASSRGPGATAEQRNRWFDAMIGRKIDRVQDIGTLRGQVASFREIEGLIQKRIDITKDITRRLNLEDQLVGVRRQRKSVLEEIADNEAEAAKKVRDKANKQRQAMIDAAKAVRDGMKRISDALKDRDTKSANLTKTTALSTERILSGLGLSPADERTLRARLSHFNSAGRGLIGAGSGSGGVAVNVPVTVNVDGKVVAKTSAKYNRRSRSLNPSQRNGPNAGLVIT